MSWYFFGGFSAYAIEPSARLENHSGCSVTHGWSGEALQGEVERDLQPERLGLGDEPVERVEVAEVGMDGVVAALGSCRSPMASRDRPGPGRGCCSGPSGSRADRVDRRQVDDVEAHRGRRLEPGVGGVEGAGDPAAVLLVEDGALGAREELVPGREQRRRPVDEDRVVGAGGDQLAGAVRPHQLADLVRQHLVQPDLELVVPAGQQVGGLAQRAPPPRQSPAARRGRGARPGSPRPSATTRWVSMPAGILISALWTQVAHGSDHPSTRNVQAPSRSQLNSPVHQSKPAGVARAASRTASQRRPGRWSRSTR